MDERLDLYTDYLLSSVGRTTATGLSHGCLMVIYRMTGSVACSLAMNLRPKIYGVKSSR
jgi:hypothetical protein